MDQLKKLFATLTMTQKIGLVAAVIALAFAIPAFTKWQRESNFKPLFTGMAPDDAAAVVAKLKENGVDYRLADGGASVLVPADKVDEARLQLAAAGLPKSGRIGFELFDKTNLSLTDFTEHVNFQRALEGELEKTIKSINGIEQARVHVTFPKDSVFLDSRQPAKASVLLHVSPGIVLQPQNVAAITNLVASAVEGLSPDAVSVVDMHGNLLSKRRTPSLDGPDGTDNTLDYKAQVEKALMQKVEATLDPLLGEGRFRFGVTADCDFSTSEQTDEVYDPSRSAMSTSQKTEDLSQGGYGLSGIPGTPSNLPRSEMKAQAAGQLPPAPGTPQNTTAANNGNSANNKNNSSGPNNITPTAAANAAAPSSPTVSRRTENVAFETSRTVRQVKVPRGIIRKISAALLIDQDVEWQGKGKQRKKVLIAASPERIKAIHDIVAGVLGISTDRGDQLVVETLPFEQDKIQDDAGSESGSQPAAGKNALKDLLMDKKVWIGAGAGLVFIIILIVFLARRPSAVANEQLTEKPVILPGRVQAQVAGADGAGASSTLAGVEAPEQNQKAIKEIEEAIPGFQLPAMTNHTKALLDHLRKSVVKDPDTAANVIRSWMEEA